MNCGDKSIKLYVNLKDKCKTCGVIYYSYKIPPRYKVNWTSLYMVFLGQYENILNHTLNTFCLLEGD